MPITADRVPHACFPHKHARICLQFYCLWQKQLRRTIYHYPALLEKLFRLFGRVPLGRAIAQYLSGRGERHCINAADVPRAQKGYLRISLTRCASCIVPVSPAMAAAERVSSACAPEITPHLCLVAYVYLRSLPAVCAELSQGVSTIPIVRADTPIIPKTSGPIVSKKTYCRKHQPR